MCKRKELLVGFSMFLVVLTAVCGFAAEPKSGGTLVWRVGAETASMDPHLANTYGSTQL